ncbi:MAG: peptidoglycan-binding protein [Rhodobacter sp.]|nr:peptidoglycan-binding protein [Rhodobacter sp.]HPD93474.1 peptidoglycan-binding domain-containing protein [Pararhodobacter sp.]
MMRRIAPVLLSCVLATGLAACQVNPPEPEVRRDEAAPASLSPVEGAACWATDRVPARTATDLVAVGPTGERQPRTRVLHPAEDRLFAVPCPDQMGPDTIASLQRALAARGLHGGAVTGVMDAETAAAVRRYQAPRGLDSAILSLDAAQQLGLVPVPRDRL